MRRLRQTFGILLLINVAGLGAFHARVDHLVHQAVPPSVAATQISEGDQYYFAYGSNMSKRYLYNVRGILPTTSEAGVIENHEVVFLSPGVNSLEPAFAYLVKVQAKRAYGVLYRVAQADLIKVKESEGALYKWDTLPVKLANGQVVAAQTLVRLSDGTAGTPSRRYVQILAEGASEHGLPAEYVDKLRSMPSVYVPVASELMGDIVQANVMKTSGKCASLLAC